MQRFRVRWEIDIAAENEIDASVEALRIQRDPESIATIFDVINAAGVVKEVDLLTLEVKEPC